MATSKNVGRKRLGRIAITGVVAKPVFPVNRPCQIVQRNNAVKKNISKSPESYPMDLSFSSSFASDLDTDIDLMSALDKMETEYGNKSLENTQNKIDSTSNVPDTRTAGIDVSRIQPKEGYAKDNKLKCTPARVGSKNKVSTIEKQKISDSFHDLSFASPMDISTPQIFKAKRSNSSSKRSAAGRQANNSTCSLKKSVEENKKNGLKFKTSTPQVTPCRSHRMNSGQKGRNQMKKRVLDGLESTNTEVNKAKSTDKSDFFRSLMVENDSLDESNIGKDNCSKRITSPGNAKTKVQLALDKDKEHKIGNSEGTTDIRDRITDKTVQKEENCKQVVTGNQTEDSNKINVEDLPQIPTKGGNRHGPSKSVSAVGRTLEIQPDFEADQLALSSWGLPEAVLNQYHSRGITHMFQWQAECLLMGNVLGNLVYSAPTSAGKTMVAELLVLKRVMETRKKAIIILPFVSVTREKMFYLQDLYQDAGIRVSGFMGHHAPAGGFSSVDVAVCTIEKGNSLVNRMLEENKLDQLGIIVIDELHLIGDRHRGYLLELLLTKISYMSQKSKHTAVSDTSSTIQVVGMSATLPNLDLLAQWLNADLYRTDYRPVPLSECVKIGTALYDSGMNLVRDIDVRYAVKGDEDHVVPLCIETIRDGHSILIFCPTKNWCEKLSETVAREFYNLLKNPEVAVTGQGFMKASDLLVLPLDQSALKDVVEQLRRTPVGVDSVLGRTVHFGVAYHHAGLTFDERDIIEGAFRQGILKVLIATSTLSSGVNLPARRVLIRTPVFHGQLIDFLTYKQMIGRAGRKGVDTAGESILLCKPNERCKAEKLVRGALPAVHSTLIRNEGEPLSSSLKRAILEVVVSGVAMSPAEVACYASCTLLAASLTKEQDQTQDLIQQCIEFLQENEFVCTQQIKGSDGVETERFVPTQLGAAVLASSISPDEGLVVFSELQRARQCFVLENELHIIYQVTPIYAQIDSIDWYQYFSIWETLTVGMRKVAELVGIQESFLAKAVRGRILTKTSAQIKLLAIHKRFYTALVLHDLVQETPVNNVSRKYNCNKGQLQSLQQSAATFAGMVTVFCARLGWSNLELILSQFQNRLTFGVQRELCDLVRISALNGQRARVMYNGGYQTVAALASAHPADIEALLKNSAPFQSNKKQDTESEWEAEERRKTRCIFLTGRKGVTEYEAALVVINEAKSIIQEELGGLGIQWKGGGNEPGPSLKSPVLLSPLAATSRARKGQNRQSSDLKSTKSMSPSDKEDASTKVPVTCVISPPAPKSESRKAVETNKDANKETDAEAEIVSKVPKLNVINAISEGLTEQTISIITSEQKNNIKNKGHSILSNVNGQVENRPIDTHFNKSNKDKTDILSKSLEKRNEAQADVYQDSLTTTAVIESMPQHLVNMKTSIEIINAETVEDTIKFRSENTESEKGVTSYCITNKDKIQKREDTVESIDNNIKMSASNDISISNCKTLTITKEAAVEIDTLSIEEAKTKRKLTAAGSIEDTLMSENAQTSCNNADPVKNAIQITKEEISVKTDFVENRTGQNKKIEEQDAMEKKTNTFNSNADKEKSVLAANKSTNPVLFSPSYHEKLVSDKRNNVNEQNDSKIIDAPKSQAKVFNQMANNSDFGESFMIDTQCMECLENPRNRIAVTGNVCTTVEKLCKEQIPETKQNLVNHSVENAFLEGLFSEDLNMDSFNTSERNILDCGQSQSARKIKDEKMVMGAKKERRFNVSDSGSEVDVSHNALDMNISQFSSEDMFNQSADLVAASNYERVGLSDDSRTENLEINDSYQDLHIPYQSGQEKCFEKADAPAPFIAKIVTNQSERNYGISKSESNVPRENVPAFGQQLNVLGQFSSQKQALGTLNSNGKLHEDLAMALEMGESFSSTFNVPTQTEGKVMDKNVCQNDELIDDKFGDSLTISMVEKALEESNEITDPTNIQKSSSANSEAEKAAGGGNSSKHICDNKLKTELKMKSNGNMKHNLLLNVNNQPENSRSFSGDEFVTPKREAVRRKRQRESPVVRNSKVQKTKENGYSTPEALEKHVKRTNKVQDNGINKIDPSKEEGRSRNGRKRKSGENKTPVSEKSRRGSVNEMNTSTGSDCVPPTPPDEVQIGSILASARTPSRSPLVTISLASPFSPKIQRNVRNKSNLQQSMTADSESNVLNKNSNHTKAVRNKSKNNERDGRSAQCRNEGKGRKEKNSKLDKVKEDCCNLAQSKNNLCEKVGKSNVSGEIGKSHPEIDDGTESVAKDDNEENEDGDNEADKDFLSPSFIDPDESGIPLTQSSFTIIDVCGDKRLFKTFIMEWRTKARYAVSLACEKVLPDCPGGGIGANLKPGDTPKKQSDKDSGMVVDSLGIKIVGIAVSWENRDAYYVSFTHEHPAGDPDDSLAPPQSDTDISIAIRLKAVKSVLQQAVCKQQAVTMVMFDVKAHYRALAEGCGFAPKGQCEDPKIACWMLDPGAKEKNLHRMVTNLLPTEVYMLHGIGGGIGVSSLGMSPQNPGSGRYRATTEAVLVRHLGEYFRACLEKENIYGTFRDVEMPSAVTLCRMELNGFGFSHEESENQKTVMSAKLSALEEQAYLLAGHPFSLSATEDVAQVLYVELQLPPNGDPTAMPALRSLAPKRGAAPRRGRGKPQYSTSKDILEKLKKLHPLPGIILEWRRITNALTKTVFPLQKDKVHCDWLSMHRIYGDCQLHTATGRVSMTEPNLQNVPKDFDITLPDLIGESPPPNMGAPPSRRTRAGNSRLQQMIGQKQVAKVTEQNAGSQFCVSMRHAFIPFKGGVMLAADYSQLELRMISYLSNDHKLIGILNKEGDVFKLITAQWKNIKPEDVTPEQRAQAKQVCYGMIYGIGAKALAEQLDVEENDAAAFIETFKAKYPGMRAYLRQTVEDCRVKGYVQTMLGRKRYLQTITGTNPHARAQAERQAVNTTVQGSAADLVKMAMIRIDERLAEMFPHTQYTHKHKLTGKHPSRVKVPPDGAYLVLQLHDELIYEASETHVHTVAQLVKHCMETAMKLPVKMPVKVKVGPSWGKLQDYEV